MVWHRRSGKDKTCLNVQIKDAWKHPGVYYYFYPTYSQGRKAIWDGIDKNGMKFIDHIPKELRIGKPREDDMQIKMKCKDGGESIWQVVGVDKIDSVVGTNPRGCVFSEYALQHPSAWDLIRPILVENGGWAIFNTTPRGHNHAYKLLCHALASSGWYVSVKTVMDTVGDNGKRIISDDAIQQEILEGMPDELVQQEFFCSFSGSLVGAYYGKQIEEARQKGRIRSIPWEQNIPVKTYWDLGRRDATAIWFVQEFLDEIRLIDYFEAKNEGLPFFAKIVRDKPYVYEAHYGPHDLEVHDYTTNTSRRDAARSLGIRFRTVPRHKVEDRIDATRRILNKCYFDEKKCEDGIRALQAYAKEYDDKRKIFMATPRHDWACHAADAFGLIAMTYKGISRNQPEQLQTVAESSFSIFSR
jgi:hypothetical protein